MNEEVLLNAAVTQDLQRAFQKSTILFSDVNLAVRQNFSMVTCQRTHKGREYGFIISQVFFGIERAFDGAHILADIGQAFLQFCEGLKVERRGWVRHDVIVADELTS